MRKVTLCGLSQLAPGKSTIPITSDTKGILSRGKNQLGWSCGRVQWPTGHFARSVGRRILKFGIFQRPADFGNPIGQDTVEGLDRAVRSSRPESSREGTGHQDHAIFEIACPEKVDSFNVLFLHQVLDETFFREFRSAIWQ
jgi:hypothetical protein